MAPIILAFEMIFNNDDGERRGSTARRERSPHSTRLRPLCALYELNELGGLSGERAVGCPRVSISANKSGEFQVEYPLAEVSNTADAVNPHLNPIPRPARAAV